jgi:hypothetical protein
MVDIATGSGWWSEKSDLFDNARAGGQMRLLLTASNGQVK